jgi:hypothetical protein
VRSLPQSRLVVWHSGNGLQVSTPSQREWDVAKRNPVGQPSIHEPSISGTDYQALVLRPLHTGCSKTVEPWLSQCA